MSDRSAQQQLHNTLAIANVKANDYDVIFLPGGHGTMWDFPTNPDLTRLIEEFDRQQKLITAVCHAPAALVTAKSISGEPFNQNIEKHSMECYLYVVRQRWSFASMGEFRTFQSRT
jgi:putative intracellular protease/amidase